MVLKARAEILTKISLGFLVHLKTPKGHFEINWPLKNAQYHQSLFIEIDEVGKLRVVISHIFSRMKVEIPFKIKPPLLCKKNPLFWLDTSHSAYVATDTESNGAKIDGF